MVFIYNCKPSPVFVWYLLSCGMGVVDSEIKKERIQTRGKLLNFLGDMT